MSNIYAEFRRLIAPAPLLVGTISAIDAGGVIITLPDGTSMRARGEGAVNDSVFVRDGIIEGPAPSLSVTEIEI